MALVPDIRHRSYARMTVVEVRLEGGFHWSVRFGLCWSWRLLQRIAEGNTGMFLLLITYRM